MRKDTLAFFSGVALFLVMPAILYALFPELAIIVYYLVVASFLYMSFLQYVEILGSFIESRTMTRPLGRYPPMTIVLPCYMPVDGSIIVDTAKHMLSENYNGKKEVLVCYDPPGYKGKTIEKLRSLGVRVIRNRHRKKAGAVNTCIEDAKGEVIAIFDADHRPRNLNRAVEVLMEDPNTACVQGRCYERHRSKNILTRTLSVAMDVLYLVSHPGRTRTEGTPVFGGSNGFWKANVLKQMKLREDMLTEDIDLSVRTMLDGYRIEYDPEIASSELPPATFMAYWKQRVRWAQGWMQVGKRHVFNILRSDLDLKGKANFFVLFCWGPFIPLLFAQIVPLVAVDLFVGTLPKTALLYWVALHNGLVIPIFGMAAYLHMERESRPLKDFALFIGLALIFVIMGFLQTIQSLMNEILGNKKWMVTKKG